MKNTTRLRKQVGELFELSKLEARQIKLNPEPFGMAELLQDVTAKFQLQARQKEISIETSQEELNQMVYADLALMERVLQNLLDNAIRYTPDREQIKLSLKQKGQLLEFSITNSGVGIPGPELPKIFDRYYRSGNQSNGQSGTGLGLAIVKNILELHDSQIEVTSEQNKYTRFFFSLPVYFSNVPEPV
jgi:signal transduction histidine kinase